MKSKFTACFLVLCMCMTMSACTSKLTNISPDRVERMEVVELLSGEKIELLHEGESMAVKQQLIEQLKQPFRSDGNCNVDDGHTYQIVMFVDDQVHANIIINGDGSACKEGKHFILAEEGKFLDLYTYQNLFSGVKAAENEFGKPYVPENIERGTSSSLVETEDYTYFYENVKMDGKRYTVVARTSDVVPIEIILAAPEIYGDKYVHTFSYEAFSYEQSGNAFIYFCDFDSDTHVSTLYFFSLETEVVGEVFDGQTSNMVVFEDPDEDVQGIGWVAYKDMIVAVNLEDGSSDEGLTKTIAELGNMDETNGHFFGNPTQNNNVKYTQLSAGEDNILIIKIMEGKGTDIKTVAEYKFDCTTQKLVVEQEEEKSSRS